MLVCYFIGKLARRLSKAMNVATPALGPGIDFQLASRLPIQTLTRSWEGVAHASYADLDTPDLAASHWFCHWEFRWEQIRIRPSEACKLRAKKKPLKAAISWGTPLIFHHSIR